jgi:hypothetical protein
MPAPTNLSNKRLQPRWALLYYLPVIDRLTGVEAGRLADISSQGMKLLSETFIWPGIDFQFRVVLPTEMFEADSLELDACSAWSKQQAHSKYFDTGFRLVNLSQTSQLIIQQLIANYGMTS